jgi:hypothetical protein
MMKRLICSVAFSIGVLIGLHASAGTVVTTASGSIGGVQLDNTGVSGGVSTIVIGRLPNLFSFVNTANGASIAPVAVGIDGPITMLVHQVTPGNYSLSLVPAHYVETIGATPGMTADLSFALSSGVAPLNLPNFFNASGAIAALLDNNNPVLDFSRFGGGGTINFTFTGTTFSTGIDSFAGLFATPGSEIVANGSFSQAVAEPESVAMLSTGMVAIGLCFHFMRRKRVWAA